MLYLLGNIFVSGVIASQLVFPQAVSMSLLEIFTDFQGEDWRQPNINIHQYFICDGLMIAVRITDKMGTHFYGDTFVHCTSVALAVKNGIVSYCDESFRIFAWGKGGK
jgi:hypothetical protein